jgi:hypothetical protein
MTELKMRAGLSVNVLAWALWALSSAYATDNIDPTNKHAYAENIGWVNAAPTNGGVTVHFDGTSGYLTGLAWGANVGWIKLGDNSGGPYANSSATDWGVNLDAAGNLTGYAWGENVGWINFSHAECDAAMNPATGEFSGNAWGENIGWVRFKGASPAYNVRTLAFDRQPQGVPNWWLAYHNVGESHDAGDGVPAWKKYIMDTDPNVSGDYLRVTAISNLPTATVTVTFNSSARRYYTLQRSAYLQTGEWTNVVTQIHIQGVGGQDSLQDTTASNRQFYRVEVTVTP